MNRKKLIPLLLLLLLLLLIVCVWCHSGDIVKNRAMSASHVNKDINFNFVKTTEGLELTGDFSTDKSIQVLHTAIGDTKFNNLSHINKELVAKEGVVLFSQKLLLDFNEHYQSGSISYSNGKLTVEGVVENEDDKNAISTLLANSKIDSQNNTRVVVSRPTAEEIAEIKAQEEAKLLALAEKEAKTKALELEKSQLEAEAKEKAIQEAETLKEEQARREAEKQATAQALEAKIKDIIDSRNINFELNRDTLTTQSITTIEKIAEILNSNPSINVEISGHTDSSGNSEKNLLLSQKRVNRVKEKLIELQIDSHRLRAVGYGANQPLVSNDTKENRQINRRVEFKVIGE